MKLQFGMSIVTSDGVEGGVLERVLVQPLDRKLTHLVVRSDELSEEVVVPITVVGEARGGQLHLRITYAALQQMPRYYEGRVSSPPSGRVDTNVVGQPTAERAALERALSVPDDDTEIGRDTSVEVELGMPVEWIATGLTVDDETDQITAVEIRTEDMSTIVDISKFELGSNGRVIAYVGAQ